ncbi:hypothetical protein CRYUN_Cryun40dG0039300 [Craigia yunnanensis]
MLKLNVEMSRTLASASFHSLNTISNWSATLAASPRFSPQSRPSHFHFTPISHYIKKLSSVLAMDSSKAGSVKELPVGLDEATEEEYASQSKLLQEITSISSIDKAWTFKSDSGLVSQAMFSISQPNLLANKKRKFMLSTSISKESNNNVNFQWTPFPVEMAGVSIIVPSPSGSKLLVIRNPENESPLQFEIWSSSQLEKEFQIPQSVHGSVYADGWFEGISWNSDESLIAYVAEEPSPPKPSFDYQGFKKGATKDKECSSWKGQGDWEEEWGECYAGKRQPALFVINLNSGKVHAVKGIVKSLSVGQVVWAPPVEGTDQYLVFVGLYVLRFTYDWLICFHSIKSLQIPIVNCAEDGHFPGLYCSSFLSKPWLSDGCTMILSSYWHSCQVILSVNVLSGEILRISPADSDFSWNVLTLDGDNVIAVCSSPIDVPQIKYGCFDKAINSTAWHWLNVSSSIFRCSEKVMSLLSSHQFSIVQIPVKDVADCLTKGAAKPFEAIFVSSKKNDAPDPLIVILHGGPHSVSLSSFSKSLAFLSSIGFSLLIVNYRGSLGFGEEALQSLPGKIGSQDVNDVLTAIDHVIEKGLANPSKITVLGGSHGGFLTTHLIGQAPDKFVAAAARNPVCNISSMVGITDIPDWCYMEVYGSNGKSIFTEAPSAEHLTHFYNKSPISHISKVKAPTLILLGAQDLRVPVSNGLQYSRALKDRGVETKVIVFPNDIHGIERPQSDFESFLNIGVWFKKYCK